MNSIKERNLDPASPQRLDCCDYEELVAYRCGTLETSRRAQIFDHLTREGCNDCRRLYELAGDADPAQDRDESTTVTEESAAAARFARLRERQLETPEAQTTPDVLSAGQVWISRPEVAASLGADGGDYLYPVLIIDPGNGYLDSDNTIRIIPLSVDTDFAWPGRSLRLGTENPLAYPCLAEFFNERPMRASDLGVFRGTLTAELLELCENERDTWLAGQSERPSPEVATWEERELELAAVLSAPVNAALWEGEEPAIVTENDETETNNTVQINANVITVDFSARSPLVLEDLPLAAADDSAEENFAGLSDFLLFEKSNFKVTLRRDCGHIEIVVVDPPDIPANLMINERRASFDSAGPGLYCLEVTPADLSTDRLHFSFSAGGRSYKFIVPLSRKLSRPDDAEK